MFRPGLVALLLCWACAAAGQDVAFGFDPRTGDAWLDVRLREIDVYARGNLDGYIDEVVISTAAPRPYIETLIYEYHYPPADVWMIAEIAQVTSVPIADVASSYRTHRGRGWGEIAKALGVRPGSPAFHALKASSKTIGKGKAASAQGRGTEPSRGKGKDAPGKGKDKETGKGKDKPTH
ncbi:MAG TPA: hypothetical protein VEA16_03295 [Vicinamibacterales bacterium]|nr:hypothetical protein [Vicinamibacterales bacterium]